MTFARSIIVLVALSLCISFGYFVGYGLAVHSVTPMIYGAGLLLAGAALVVFMSRRDRERHPGRLERHGWR